MKENTGEKSLMKINENSIFYKIKQFFRNLFHKNEITDASVTTEVYSIIESDEDKRNLFMEDIKKIENEETILLKLQKKYRNGENVIEI